jgi:hypothetical protein
VVAVDKDVSGLDDIKDNPKLTIVQHDLESDPKGSWPFPKETKFSLIIVFK